MDNKDIFGTLCSLYSSSDIPTAVIRGDDVWENAPFRKLVMNRDGEKEKFFSDIRTETGICYKKYGKSLYKINTAKTDNISVAEIISKENVSSLIKNANVFDYAHYTFELLRSSVGDISAVSNYLANLFSGNKDLASADEVLPKINDIDSRLADIMNDIIEPEQIVSLLTEDYSDATVCINDELARTVRDIENSADCETGLVIDTDCCAYSRLSRQALRVILTDAIASCYIKEYIPDKVTVSLQSKEYGFAEISVVSDCSSRYTDSDRKRPSVQSCGKMFFDYLCSMFCERFGGSVTIRQLENGNSTSLLVPTITSGYAEFSAPEKYLSIGKFDVVSLRFGRRAADGDDKNKNT